MAMELGCIMPPTLATPENIRIAEELGYVNAWVFYSPAIYVDPWMVLALAAERTSTIGLGVSVIVPRLRHVADWAMSIATLHELAPGRVTIAVGAGFSSTALLAGKNVPWAQVETFICQLRTLLAGGAIEVDGVKVALLHSPQSGITLPIEVPLWVAAHGPKGLGVAERIGDGVITNPTHGDRKLGFGGAAGVSYYGTVLDEGEDHGDAAVIERTGPSAALALHMGPYGPLAGSPEERGFTAEIEKFPAPDRLVATHRGHLIAMSDLDRKFVNGAVVRDGTMTGTAAEIHARLDQIEASGATLFGYTPVGPDVPRELEAFAAAFHR